MRKLSNQGQDLDDLLKDLDFDDLTSAAEAGWREVATHPSDATCQCVALEILAMLYGLGYRLTKPTEE